MWLGSYGTPRGRDRRSAPTSGGVRDLGVQQAAAGNVSQLLRVADDGFMAAAVMLKLGCRHQRLYWNCDATEMTVGSRRNFCSDMFESVRNCRGRLDLLLIHSENVSRFHENSLGVNPVALLPSSIKTVWTRPRLIQYIVFLLLVVSFVCLNI